MAVLGILLPAMAICGGAVGACGSAAPVAERGQGPEARSARLGPLEDTFSVLRRERRASDHYHGDLSRMAGDYGLDPSRARVSAASADGRTFTVIPGRWGICLERQIGRQAGGSCASTAAARAGELVFTVEGGPDARPGAVEVVGLAADGVREVDLARADGQRVTAPVRENVYAVAVDGTPDAVHWSDTSGPRALPLP